MCGHGWPNIAGAWEKRRYVDLGHARVLYHFYLIFFYKLFIFFKKKKKKETDNALFSAAFNFFILKYLKKTPQNLSKPHIDLKTKTQLNKKKKKKRDSFFFIHIYDKKWLMSIFSSKETDDTRFGHSSYRNCVHRLFSVIHLFTTILFVLS